MLFVSIGDKKVYITTVVKQMSSAHTSHSVSAGNFQLVATWLKEFVHL